MVHTLQRETGNLINHPGKHRAKYAFSLTGILGALIIGAIVAGAKSQDIPRVVINDNSLYSSLPTLTTAERKSIVTTALKDRSLLGLLRKRRYNVRGVQAWTTSTGTVLGGVAIIPFPRALTLAGTWLGMDYDCTEQSSPPYRRFTYTAERRNVTMLLAFVNLRGKQVAAIETNPNSQVVGTVHIKPHNLHKSC